MHGILSNGPKRILVKLRIKYIGDSLDLLSPVSLSSTYMKKYMKNGNFQEEEVIEKQRHREIAPSFHINPKQMDLIR